MADLIFAAQFVTAQVGKTGLTVTVDVDRYTISDGSRTALVTGGAATEGRRGLYSYRLASADLALYQYIATFITTNTTVDQQEIPALGLVVPDMLTSAAPPSASDNATAAAYAVWNENMADHLGPTSTGGRLDMASRAAPVGDMIESVGYQRFKTTALENMRPAVGLATANLDAQLAGLPTAADVQAAATAALEAYDPPTMAELTSAVAPLALGVTAQAILKDTGTTLPALIGGLSGATVTVVSSVAGGTVTVYVADTWRFTVASDQLALADYETLGLIVKRSARQADTQALLYLRTDTGLVRIGGAAPASAANGELTVEASSFTGVVHVEETQGLRPGSYSWWLKGLDLSATPDEAATLATGAFVVLAAGLQAVV